MRALLVCAACLALVAHGRGADTSDKSHSPADVFAAMAKVFQKEKAKGLHITYLFHLTNPQGGDWWIKVDDGKCTMGKGTPEKADCTLICSGADWVALDNEELGGMRAFVTGRLKIQGNRELARKLNELFP